MQEQIWRRVFEALQDFCEKAKIMLNLLSFSVVDKTIPESDIEICRKIAEDCGVKFRLREYIE